MARAVNSQAGRLSTRRGRGRVGDSESGVRVVIDPEGYRPNVGIVLMHPNGRVFWARRVRRDGWQFPPGGMNTDETPLEAMYRELGADTGLRADHGAVLSSEEHKYDLLSLFFSPSLGSRS